MSALVCNTRLGLVRRTTGQKGVLYVLEPDDDSHDLVVLTPAEFNHGATIDGAVVNVSKLVEAAGGWRTIG